MDAKFQILPKDCSMWSSTRLDVSTSYFISVISVRLQTYSILSYLLMTLTFTLIYIDFAADKFLNILLEEINCLKLLIRNRFSMVN